VRTELLSRRDRVTCLLLFIASFLLFLPRVSFPNDYNFDEMHYVTAAKLLVPPEVNFNWEHPPMAKYMIGLGILLAGDRPLGWRLASMVFGAISVAGIYVWALAVFRQRWLAVWVALIALMNCMLFVLARIAMLDIFMCAFLVWGMAMVSFAWDVQRPTAQVRRLLAAAGVFFGLAAACKWVGFVLVIFVFLLWVMLRVFRLTGSTLYRLPRGQREGIEEWYTADLWAGVTWRHALAWLLLTPVIVYLLAFVPFLHIQGIEGSPRDILRLQLDMARTQASITGNHPYASDWYQWPFDWKPMWYTFISENGWTRAVLLIGNPLILLGGFVAALFCAWEWWKRRTRDAFLASVWYWLLLLCFTAIPRKISFFHYYLPAACALGLSLAYVFLHYGEPPVFRRTWGRWAFLAAAALVFLVFYPVLAGMPLPADFHPR
jgi:dolichyl-phosphate-mannose--protein O-mannosyl transferase